MQLPERSGRGVRVPAARSLLHEACCTLFKQSTDADVRHCLTCNDREERKAG
jgi:hypothetical protein